MLPNRPENQNPKPGDDDRAESELSTRTRYDEEKNRDQVDTRIPDQIQDEEKARRARRADQTSKTAK